MALAVETFSRTLRIISENPESDDANVLLVLLNMKNKAGLVNLTIPQKQIIAPVVDMLDETIEKIIDKLDEEGRFS